MRYSVVGASDGSGGGLSVWRGSFWGSQDVGGCCCCCGGSGGGGASGM